jgi:dipeptidyl aminopeptidase/acylaminoacyl peptidase
LLLSIFELFNNSNTKSNPMRKHLYYAATLLVFFSSHIFAQKKPLNHTVYDSWKEISDQRLSSTGRHVVYNLNPQEGDGRLVIFDTQTSKSDSIPRGSEAKLNNDASYVICKIKPQNQAVKTAKRAKKKKEEMPKDSLGIYDLASGKLTKIAGVQSFKFPEKTGSWLAYMLESTPPVKTDDKAKPSKKEKKESEENGYKLVIRNLQSGLEKTFGFVTDYEIDKYAKRLIFSTSGADSTMTSGVYSYDLQTQTSENIYKAKGKMKRLSLSEDAQQAAFVADLDTNTKTLIRLPKLLHWKKGDTQAKIIKDSENQSGLSFVNEHFVPRFSKDGSRLFFGTNPKPIVADTNLLPEETVNVEVWSWTDKRLQPQQKVSLEQDKKKAYISVANLSDGKVFQLSDQQVPEIQLDKDLNNDVFLATSTEPYSNKHWDWHGTKDIYVVSAKDGSHTRIATHVKGSPTLSPAGQYITWWSLADSAWFAYSIAKKNTIKLTDNKTVKFFDEEDDHPDYPNAYGSVGWLNDTDNPTFLVNDRYDVWQISLKDLAKTRLTKGREKQIEYRYVRLDADEKYLLTKLWKTTNTLSKAEGIANADGRQLFEENLGIGQISKAKIDTKVIFTKQSFQLSPDIYLADIEKFSSSHKKISEANPQQKNYRWGTVEMVSWLAGDGTPLQGLLYKPEDFDASKQYPMMVYFYEKETDNLHRYIAPSPIRASINYSYFTSNGYLVFVPDIVYKDGNPGQSAYNCIIPGVLSLLNKGFVNKARIGIQGHSWGGYQTAYLITQTNLFRAAEAGAPVANMTSAYGGIRWESGLARQAQYEFNQSRIGGTLWEKPQHYIENSPLFYSPKVQTPLLMMHNDDDGAVPWYQGIEFYLALKRLDKPVWLLNYNGEKHGLIQRKNRKDWAIRMYQFFDHYLKDAPAPSWMKEGLPMIEKGINQHIDE